MDTVLTWKAPRAVNHERSVKWYITGGVFVIAGAVYGLLSGVWSFTLVCVLCGALYFLIRDHQSPDIECSMNDKGVEIGGKFLAWDSVRGYWFVTTPTYSELHIVPTAKRMMDLVIQTDNIPLLTIRSFLSGKAEELHDKQERILDILLRLFKL